MRKSKKLSPKEQELARDWEALLARHSAGPQFTRKNQNHRTPPATAKTVIRQEALRAISNDGLTVRSAPMGSGGTVPHDPSLEEAKRNLRGRVMPLFNKGGLQVATDGDLADLQRGTNRKHT